MMQLMMARTSHDMLSDNLITRTCRQVMVGGVALCVCVCVCAYLCLCVLVCVCMCVHARAGIDIADHDAADGGKNCTRKSFRPAECVHAGWWWQFVCVCVCVCVCVR